MVAQAIIQRLQLLGLEPDEAAVYVHLQILGPSRAAQVAAAASLPRAQTYRALDRLVGMGFATTTLSRPALYTAEPPTRVFESLLASTDSQRRNIVNAELEVLAAFSDVSAKPERVHGRPKFNIIEGREQILQRAAEMQTHARTEIQLLLSFEGLASMLQANNTLPRLKRLAQSGIRVQAAFGPAAFQLLAGEATTLANFEMRMTNEPGPIGLMLVDKKQAMSFAAGNMQSRSGPRTPVAVVTDAEALIMVVGRLFDAEWERARPAPTDAPKAR